MAGRGMGAATKGGGCVESGPRNKMQSEPSKTTGPVMMAKGGDVSLIQGMKDVVTEGAGKVRDDVERLVGTQRGKQLDKEVEDKSRRGIDLVKAYEKIRQREEASRYAKGGAVNKGAINQHKKMAMGMGLKKMKKGGMC